MDLSERSLAVARQRAEVFGLQQKIRFYQGSAEELRSVVPAEPFDLIYSFGVIHHTPRPERAIAELAHFSRRGTTLKIMVYHRYAWKVFSVVLREGKGQFWRASEIVAQNSEAQTGCPVTYTYTRQSAREFGGTRRVSSHGDVAGPYFPLSSSGVHSISICKGLALSMASLSGYAAIGKMAGLASLLDVSENFRTRESRRLLIIRLLKQTASSRGADSVFAQHLVLC